MNVKQCDMCGIVENSQNHIRSRFNIAFDWKMHEYSDEDRKSNVWTEETKEKFDLCDKCAEEVYKVINKREPPKDCYRPL